MTVRPHSLAAQCCRRPRKFSDIAILRKGIEWISSVNKTGAADGEKSFYFTDCFGHHAVWLAGLKLALELNKGVIGGIESVCQHGCDIKDRDRILRERKGWPRWLHKTARFPRHAPPPCAAYPVRRRARQTRRQAPPPEQFLYPPLRLRLRPSRG